jgi:hypothetical protein
MYIYTVPRGVGGVFAAAVVSELYSKKTQKNTKHVSETSCLSSPVDGSRCSFRKVILFLEIPDDAHIPKTQ